MTRFLCLTVLQGKPRAVPRRAALLTFRPVAFPDDLRMGMRPLYLGETTLQPHDWVYYSNLTAGRYISQTMCYLVNAMSYAEREAHWLPYTLRRRDR